MPLLQLLMAFLLAFLASPNVYCVALSYDSISTTHGILENAYTPSIKESSTKKLSSLSIVIEGVPRGGGSWFFIPAGWNPFGYRITELGEKFLEFDGSLHCDVGRFLASCKSRKSLSTMKSQWLEIVRASKQGQSMRIYRGLDDLIQFCLKARLLD